MGVIFKIQIAQQMGESIAMSADGSRALFGAWIQEQDLQELTTGMVHPNKFGQDIFGTDNADIFGEYVSMNDSGTLIAVAGPNHDSDKGEVQVLNWDGSKWGNSKTFEGKAAGDKFGKREFTFQAMVIHLLLRLLEMHIKTYKWDGTNGMKKMRYLLFQVIMMLLVNYT